MSIENVKKLELGIQKSCFCDDNEKDLTEQDVNNLIFEGAKLEKEAMSSGEMDVLDRAFDYFLEESINNGLGCGGCETLENEIFQYFSMEQILSVLRKKFEKLVETNLNRATHFLSAFLNTGYIEDIRNILFEIKSTDLKIKLLDDFDECLEGTDYFQEERAILREDLKIIQSY